MNQSPVDRMMMLEERDYIILLGHRLDSMGYWERYFILELAV